MPITMNTVQSLRAVDAWIDVINANINGTVRTAYKGSKLKFAGSAPALQETFNRRVLPVQLPDAALTVEGVTIDVSHGDIIDSTEETHKAISGEGYFMLFDPASGKTYLTRDGEFHFDRYNRLINGDGLLVVNQRMTLAMTMSPFPPAPPITVAEVNSLNTAWRPAVPSVTGGGLWMPYVAGTVFDEPGSYMNQTIFAKRGYVLSSNDLTGSLRVTSDNALWVMVNGVLLGAGDVTSGMNPPTDGSWIGQYTQYNLAPYLKAGYNEILIKVTEGGGGENFTATGTIGGQTILSDGGWLTKLSTQPTNAGPPTTPELLGIGEPPGMDEIMLTKGPDSAKDLQFTKYGSTVWEWMNAPATMPVELPGTDDTGTIVSGSLEAANTSLTGSVPELAMAQRMFSALSKVLTTKVGDQDTVNNLIH
jgi:flagellar hook protein FlgE